MTISEALEVIRGELFGAGTMSRGYMARIADLLALLDAQEQAVPLEVCDLCHKPGKLTYADDGELYHEDCIERLMKSPPAVVTWKEGK